MHEGKFTPDEVVRRTTNALATGIAVAETVVGHNPMTDVVVAATILNISGVPVAPMLTAIKDAWQTVKYSLFY